MDITVIGHICKDTVVLPGNEKPGPPQFGGIVYSVAALSGLAGEGDTIHPVFGVGEQDLDVVKEFLGGLPSVDTAGIYPLRTKTNEVTLIYGDPGTPRIECSEHIAEAIPYSRIKPYLGADGVLVNMVSGSDITLETLDNIRMTVRDNRTPVHFDFHSLTLGIEKRGKRFRRPLTDWRRWCFMLGSVQMSEEEAAGLSAERYDEPTLINQLMPLMVHVLLITRGSGGVTAVVQDAHKRLHRTDIGGEAVTMQDSTGCGDVFGAAYLYSLLRSKDPVASAREANACAALHASLPASDKPRAIRNALSARPAASDPASSPVQARG